MSWRVTSANMDQTTNQLPELLTVAEMIRYLRLDVDDRNPAERLRNLVRRQQLPVIRRGRLQLFRRSAVDKWLDGDRRASQR
jgi:Helix-turn-helix domain